MTAPDVPAQTARATAAEVLRPQVEALAAERDALRLELQERL